MGQQQLLLLVLGILIVSAAVIYGIQAFDENQEKSREDSKLHKMMDFASRAQAWKSKPVLMGGGQDADPSNYSSFTVESIGLTPSGGPSANPFVNVPGTGCFRFFPNATSLRINALNDDCVIGSWTKGIIITGYEPDDITLEYRYQ